MAQETLDNANKYEMQHLAYINVLSDLHRSYQNHKDEEVTFKNSDGEVTGKAPKEIKLVYPFKESLVNSLSGEYDSQTAYYSSSLITIFRMLSDELPWLSFSLNSVKEKVYDTKAEATETSREVEENGDTVVSYSKPFREIPTINLEARFNNSSYDEQAIKRVLKDFKE